MNYRDRLEAFFMAQRQGDATGKACYWALYSGQSKGTPKADKPLEQNFYEDDMALSLDKLCEAIERQGPGQLRYFCVNLRNSKQDNGTFITIENPYFSDTNKSSGIFGIGTSNDTIAMIMGFSEQRSNADKEYFSMQLEHYKEVSELQRENDDLRAALEAEKTAKQNYLVKLTEKVMAICENHAPIILNRLLGTNQAPVAITGTNVAYEQQQAQKNATTEQVQQASENDGIDWRVVRACILELKNYFQNPDVLLQLLADKLRKQPELAQSIVAMLQS